MQTPILQPQHIHNSQPQSPTITEPQQQQSPPTSILQILLENTYSLLNQKSQQQTKQLRRYYEQKVYLSYSDSAQQYLLHMLHKSQSQSNDQVAEIIMGRQNKVVTAIKNDKYDVRVNKEGEKLKKIREELQGKIGDMKSHLGSLQKLQAVSGGKDGQKQQQIYKGYMQFRKKGYWNQQTQQSKKVKKFLSKMRHQKHQLQSKHQQTLQKIQNSILLQSQKQKQQKQSSHKKFIEQLTLRRQKIKSERKNKIEQHNKKVLQAQNFIQKYRNQKPIYLVAEEKFKKQVLGPMEEEKKRKLGEIKKNRKPLDAEELELHCQRYEEFKLKMQEVYDKREQDQELYEKNMEKLKELYHGHFHQKIQEQMNSYQDMVQQKRRMRQRINSYSAGVKDDYKPKIDQKKKQQLQSIIKLLQQKSLQKGKKKILNKDGSISYQQLSPTQHKKLGISYLQNLRKYNEGKKRKQPSSEDRSSSMIQLSKKKIVYPDYLQQMRSKSRIQGDQTTMSAKTKSSRNGWRKIISQENFSNRDKFNSVMDHVSLLEHQARQKQLELKYMKGGPKALELKEKLDKYYLESVAAKMHVLKDVILKD